MLPRLVVNHSFMAEFISARAPCFALGLVEEEDRQEPRGFLALRPDEVIPEDITASGFCFGHSLLGTADFEVVHFAFSFYGFETYNVLINPNNPVAQAVLSAMVESGDYFFFAVDERRSVTTFRSEIGEEGLAGLKTNFPRIRRSTTTETQYCEALRQFEQDPEPEGTMLHWVCRDDAAYLDLTKKRLVLRPAGRQAG